MLRSISSAFIKANPNHFPNVICARHWNVVKLPLDCKLSRILERFPANKMSEYAKFFSKEHVANIEDIINVLIVLLNTNNIVPEQIIALLDTHRTLNEEVLFEFMLTYYFSEVRSLPVNTEFILAEKLEADGKFAEATAKYHDLINISGGVPACLGLIRTYLKAKSYNEALTWYNAWKEIANLPDNFFRNRFLIDLNIAILMEEASKFYQSISAQVKESYQRVLDSSQISDGVKIYADFRLAQAHYLENKILSASEYEVISNLCRKAARKNISGAWLLIGTMYERGVLEFDIHQAINAYKNAAQIGNVEAKYYLGKLHLQFGNYELARKNFCELIDCNWYFAQSVYLSYAWMLDLGVGGEQDKLLAYKYYTIVATSVEPWMKEMASDACFKLGVVAIGDGQYLMAIKYFQRAIELNPNNGQALNNLGVLYAERSSEYFNQQEAERCFKLANLRSVVPEARANYVLLGRYFGLPEAEVVAANREAKAWGIETLERYIFIPDLYMPFYSYQGYLPGVGVLNFVRIPNHPSLDTNGDCFFIAYGQSRAEAISSLLKRAYDPAVIELIAPGIVDAINNGIKCGDDGVFQLIDEFIDSPPEVNMMSLLYELKESKTFLDNAVQSFLKENAEKILRIATFPKCVEDIPKFILAQRNDFSDAEIAGIILAWNRYIIAQITLRETSRNPELIKCYIQSFLEPKKRKWIPVPTQQETTGILDAIAKVNKNVVIWGMADEKQRKLKVLHIAAKNDHVDTAHILCQNNHFDGFCLLPSPMVTLEEMQKITQTIRTSQKEFDIQELYQPECPQKRRRIDSSATATEQALRLQPQAIYDEEVALQQAIKASLEELTKEKSQEVIQGTPSTVATVLHDGAISVRQQNTIATPFDFFQPLAMFSNLKREYSVNRPQGLSTQSTVQLVAEVELCKKPNEVLMPDTEDRVIPDEDSELAAAIKLSLQHK